MAKDKYNFILDLINNNKMSTSQKERVLKLAVKEFGKEAGVIEEIKRRLERIETKTGIASGNNEGNHPEKEVHTNINLPKYYDPSSTYKFLQNYNQDPILKSTCHLIDSNELEAINKICCTETYNFEKHYSKILEHFKQLESKEFAPPFIKSQIRGYLSGKDFIGKDLKDGWSSDGVKMHWGHKELKEWCLRNLDFPPNPDPSLAEKFRNEGFEFKDIITTKNEQIDCFSKLVIHFKKMFHIKYDNSLFEIIKKYNSKWEQKIDFRYGNFQNTIELFTDVDKLLQAYNEIIELIIDNKKEAKPQVKLSFIESDENTINFSIHALNSIYSKTIHSFKNRPIGQKYSGIINKLNGLCNIYLQADFTEGDLAKFILWDNDVSKKGIGDPIKLDNSFTGGVEHILEFKRK